jgi:hypothetical protein
LGSFSSCGHNYTLRDRPFGKMKLILIIVLSSTLYEFKPIDVPPGMSCSQLYDKIVYYVKNPNYSAGNGQIWIQAFHNKQAVGGYYCEAK